MSFYLKPKQKLVDFCLLQCQESARCCQKQNIRNISTVRLSTLHLHATPSLNTTASVASLPLEIFIQRALLFSAPSSPNSLLPKHLQQRCQWAVDVAASHVTLHAMMIILRSLFVVRCVVGDSDGRSCVNL